MRKILVGVIFSAGFCAAQDYPGDMPISRVLVDGEGWQVAASGARVASCAAVDRAGHVYFSDVPQGAIYRIAGGERVLVDGQAGRTTGLVVGADDRLYACRADEKKIVAYGADGKAAVLAEGVDCGDLTVTAAGEVYFTDPVGGRIWHLPPGGKPRAVAEGLHPTGLTLSPDEGTLFVGDEVEPVLWAFRVQADGALTHRDRYCRPLRMPDQAKETGTLGMTVDKAGRIYAATAAGLQMFDPTGRLGGVIASPEPLPLRSVVFGGADYSWLYVACGTKVYKRKTKSPGEPVFLRLKPK